MAIPTKCIKRSDVHLMAASLFAGFGLQTGWAVDHDFEYYRFRVFVSALVLFGFLQGLRAVLKRVCTGAVADFDAKYAEFVLLLALIPVFQIIHNTFIQTVVMLAYAFILITYAATVLEIGWCQRLRNWLAGSALPGFRRLLSRRLSYSIDDDIEPAVLNIRLRVSGDASCSASLIKSRVASLYQDLPDAGEFREMKVNIDEVHADDKVLARLLEPLSYYASLTGIARVVIAGGKERLGRLAAVLPEGRYALQDSESGRD